MIRRPPRSTLFPYTTLFRSCRALGGTPPDGFNYELFLDEAGGKISKSKGNGLTIDQWLRYASPESLSDRKSTRLNSSHANISYAVFCLKKKKKDINDNR